MAGTFLVEKYLQDVAVEEAKPELQLPRQYQVFLLNDDYTTMEFVVEVLQSFFQKDEATATRIMLQIHTQGKGICGLFSRDIAETKVAQVNEFANRHQQPLLCSMEPE